MDASMALAEHDTLFRFFHVLSGITWIGLLYFFNLVNLPLLKFDMKKPFSVNMTEKATMHITLKTLFWFRWGAAFTFIFGLLLIGSRSEMLGGMGNLFNMSTFAGQMISVGVLFGTIMAFNVWFIIWPAQQKIMKNNKAIAEGGDKDKLGAENAPLVKNAVFASRMNTWMSVPMLFGMIFGAHGQGDSFNWGNNALYLGIMVLLLAVMYWYSTRKLSTA
jgi:uncharacterized membrane protein